MRMYLSEDAFKLICLQKKALHF